MKSPNRTFTCQPGESILWKGDFVQEDDRMSRYPFVNFIFLVLDYLERFYWVGIVGLIIYGYILNIIGHLDFLMLILYGVLYFGFVIGATLVERKVVKCKQYIVTNHRVVFKEWNLWKGHLHYSLLWNDVDKISLVEFEEGISTIYFMGTRLGSFKNTEHYPALHRIKDSEKILPEINRLIDQAIV